jgi:hypothetical protein
LAFTQSRNTPFVLVPETKGLCFFV